MCERGGCIELAYGIKALGTIKYTPYIRATLQTQTNLDKITDTPQNKINILDQSGVHKMTCTILQGVYIGRREGNY